MESTTSVIGNITETLQGKGKCDQVRQLHQTLLHVLHEWDRTESAVAPVRVSCPCAGHTHNDANPSLDVSVQELTDPRGRKSYVLSFNCWTRKHTPADMLKAVGEEFWLELFAQWKGLPLDILKRAGVHVEADEKGRLHYTFPYHDLNLQEVIGTRYRWLPKRFWFEKGLRSSESLFVPLPVESDTLCLVEGETDALALASAGFPVAGVAGKGILFSEKPSGRRLYKALSKRFRRLYISVEPDAEEETAALSRQIAGLDVEVYLIRMQGMGYKDPCEMLRAMGGERFREEWQRLMHEAKRVEPDEAAEASAVKPEFPVESAQDVMRFIQTLMQQAQEPDVIIRGLDVAKEALKAVRRGRKPVNHVDIARELMQQYRFERYKDGMWWYDEQEGIWKGNAAELIESLVHRHVDIPDEQKRRSFAAEVVAHIEALSWSPDRELLPDPPLTLIPFRNGVYDMQTDQLRPYQPEDYFTSKLPWDYNPQAQSRILRERLAAHDETIRRHFLEFLAYCLWRSYPSHRFFIWTGGGRNGKGYLVRVLQLALGEENIAHETLESLCTDKWAPANLYRKLANIAGEVGDKELHDTKVLKGATGGDTMKGERKFQDAFHFKNHAKMLFLPNSVPPTTDKTVAFYSRTIIIEFNRQFEENPLIENELELMDKETREREFSWLLTQALTVLRELLQNGFQFTGDKSVDEKREHYERLSKPLHRFLDEHTERTYDLNDYIPKFDLLQRVNDWLKDRRLSQLTDRKLNEQMRELGFQEMKKEVQPGKKWWCFVGLKWKETAGVEQCSSQAGGVSSTGGVSSSNNSNNSNILQPLACERNEMSIKKRFEDIGVSGVSGTGNATQTPPALEDLDPFASADPSLFLQECCVVEPEAEVVAGELYAAYTRWADGRAETPLTDRAFGKWLSAAGFGADKGAKGIRIRHGPRLRDDLSLWDDDETDPIRRLRDALQSIPREQLLSLIKQSQLEMQERPHVKLAIARVFAWEQERVEYGQGYQERLSRFVEDLRCFTDWTGMMGEHLAGFVIALFTGRGLEFVGENRDTLVIGARLKPDQPPQTPYTVVTSADDLHAVVERLSGTVALDVETTGLNPREHKMRLVSLATEDGQVYLIDAFQVDVTLLQPILERCALLGHNLLFDLQFLLATGLELPASTRLLDTMLAAQVLEASNTQPPRGHFTLASVAERYLGAQLDKTLQTSDWSGELTAAQIDYALRDVTVLHPLWRVLEERLHEAELQSAMELEMQALPAVVWMALSGVPVDVEEWCRQAEADEQALQAVLERLREVADINWNSCQQVKRVLAEQGVQVTDIKESTLKEVDHLLTGLLLEYKVLQKRASAFGRKWMEFVRAGRVYPEWRQLGASTGRMACSNPNLQQIPRGERRQCFVAPEGRTLVIADYSQIELRIAAELAGDERMIEAFQRGEDLHTLTARLVLGKQEVTKEDSTAAKALNFGLLYGMGWRGLQRYATAQYGVHLTDEQAFQFRERFFQTYTGLAGWHEETRRVVEQDDTCEAWTLGGRRRVLHRVGDRPPLTDALNTPVQGTGADGLKATLALLWQEHEQYPSARLVMAVHDEVVLECDEADAQAVAEWLTDCMKRAMARFLHTVPLEVETHICKTWNK